MRNYSIINQTRLALLIYIVQQSTYCNLDDENPYKGNCLSEIEKNFDIKQSTLSHHLSKLEEDGLIIKTKKGKWIYIFANNDNIEFLLYNLKETLLNTHKINSHKINLKNSMPKDKFQDLLEFISIHQYEIVHTNLFHVYFKSAQNPYISLKVVENFPNDMEKPNQSLQIEYLGEDISSFTILIKRFLSLNKKYSAN